MKYVSFKAPSKNPVADPKCNMSASSTFKIFISEISRFLSAPLTKEKSLSPFSSNETKAKVVGTLESLTNNEQSTPCSKSVCSKKTPKASCPTFPQNNPFPPKRLITAATLAGAPPAFFRKISEVAKLFPIFCDIKSISNSPIQIILKITLLFMKSFS